VDAKTKTVTLKYTSTWQREQSTMLCGQNSMNMCYKSYKSPKN